MENFTASLKQANLGTKCDAADFVKNRYFDDKLKDLKMKLTSNKSKRLLVENELKSYKIK